MPNQYLCHWSLMFRPYFFLLCHVIGLYEDNSNDQCCEPLGLVTQPFLPLNRKERGRTPLLPSSARFSASVQAWFWFVTLQKQPVCCKLPRLLNISSPHSSNTLRLSQAGSKNMSERSACKKRKAFKLSPGSVLIFESGFDLVERKRLLRFAWDRLNEISIQSSIVLFWSMAADADQAAISMSL